MLHLGGQVLFTLLFAQAAAAPPSGGQIRVAGPSTWVPFSAELKIEHPSRPTAFGRFLQDEHGCTRRETVHPDGSLMVTILNFETERMYRLMRGSWTSQPMRLVASLPRRPSTRPLHRKSDPLEGLDTYVSVVNVRTPTGDYTREAVVAPALNYFEVVQQLRPGGETIRAQNIKLAPPAAAEFLPPAGAVVAERPEEGGALTFQAVDIRIVFPQTPPVTLGTTEERLVELKTPLGEKLQLVTRVIDGTERLRVRVYKNAVRKGAVGVDGELLEEVELPFTGSAATTRLVENFEVTVARVGMRKFPEKVP